MEVTERLTPNFCTVESLEDSNYKRSRKEIRAQLNFSGLKFLKKSSGS